MWPDRDPAALARGSARDSVGRRHAKRRGIRLTARPHTLGRATNRLRLELIHRAKVELLLRDVGDVLPVWRNRQDMPSGVRKCLALRVGATISYGPTRMPDGNDNVGTQGIIPRLSLLRPPMESDDQTALTASAHPLNEIQVTGGRANSCTHKDCRRWRAGCGQCR